METSEPTLEISLDPIEFPKEAQYPPLSALSRHHLAWLVAQTSSVTWSPWENFSVGAKLVHIGHSIWTPGSSASQFYPVLS